MERRTTWLIFLIFGISLISCKKNIDYRIELNYVFVNNTNHNISFNENASVLNVKSLSKSFHKISSEGGKELTKENFLLPVQSLCNNCIVSFDNLKCDTLNGRGIENIKNFEFTKIKQSEYELKYTFNESDYLASKSCK